MRPSQTAIRPAMPMQCFPLLPGPNSATLRGRHGPDSSTSRRWCKSREEPIGGLALMGLGRLYYDWNDTWSVRALPTTGHGEDCRLGRPAGGAGERCCWRVSSI